MLSLLKQLHYTSNTSYRKSISYIRSISYAISHVSCVWTSWLSLISMNCQLFCHDADSVSEGTDHKYDRSNFQTLPTSTPPPIRFYPVSEWAQIFDSDPPYLPLYPSSTVGLWVSGQSDFSEGDDCLVLKWHVKYGTGSLRTMSDEGESCTGLCRKWKGSAE